MFDPKFLVAVAVIIDNGTGFCKAGRSGDKIPLSVIPTVVGRAENKASVIQSGQRDLYIANEVFIRKGILTLKCPMERGIITGWEEMEKIWKYIYDNELRLRAVDRPLLMTEHPLNPPQDRERMTEIVLETLEVPALYLSVQATLALYSAAHTTGIVLDCGEAVSQTVPIYEGYYLPHAVCKLDVAGKDITDYLSKLLVHSDHYFANTPDKEIITDIKEQLCYVAIDPSHERKRRTEEIMKSYYLPDGKMIQIANPLYLAPEILFYPTTIGVETPGIDEMIFKSIMKCDKRIRNNLYKNLILTGGSSLFPGLDERVFKQVQQQAPSGVPFSINAHPNRKFSTWIGASIITSLSIFSQMWVTSNDYKEMGPAIVHRRCF